MLSYIGHVVTLLGAAVGLVGNTWRPKARGIRKLTRTGWVAAFVMLAGFVVSSVSTYQEVHRQQRLQQVASVELQRHWRALVYPFTLMLWQVHGRSFGYDDDTLKLLADEATILAVSKINILGEAPHHAGLWPKVLSDSTKTGKAGLDNASFKFNFLLDQEIIDNIHRVTTAYYGDALVAASVYGPDGASGGARQGSDVMPLANLADMKFFRGYVAALTDLKRRLDQHLPKAPP